MTRMIGLFFITHGSYGDALAHGAGHVLELPMLLAAPTHRDQDLPTLPTRTRNGGRDGLIDLQDH